MILTSFTYNGGINESGGVLQAEAINITDNIYGSCDSSVYYDNTTRFAKNLLTVSNLLKNSSSSSFSGSFNSTEPANETQSAYATYECRGDLSLAECGTCLEAAMIYYCAHNGSGASAVVSGMTIMLRGCYYRYSNRVDYLQTLASATDTRLESCDTAPVASTQAGVMPALELLRQTAPYRSNMYASVAVVDVRNIYPPVYTLAQCLSFLTTAQCVKCLNLAPSEKCTSPLSTYSDAAIYFPSCFYVFNTSLTVAFDSDYTVFSVNFSMMSPPPSPPPPPPPPPPPSLPPTPLPSLQPSPTSSQLLPQGKPFVKHYPLGWMSHH
mgnify:CR=1 FL=1